MATEDRGTCRLLAVLDFIPKHRLERLVHLAPGQRVHLAHTHCRLDCEYGLAHRLQSLQEFFTLSWLKPYVALNILSLDACSRRIRLGIERSVWSGIVRNSLRLPQSVQRASAPTFA